MKITLGIKFGYASSWYANWHLTIFFILFKKIKNICASPTFLVVYLATLWYREVSQWKAQMIDMYDNFEKYEWMNEWMNERLY